MATSSALRVSRDRLASLDTFRGFVILSMIFVNYLPGMKDIPRLLLHAPADFDGFTATDVVFPGFLFIVGVALPLAIEKRRRDGHATAQIVAHILLRGASLIFLGVVMVNYDRYSERNALISHDLWYLLFYLSVITLWTRLPKEGKLSHTPRLSLKIAAAALLVFLLAVYRGTTGGTVTWLIPSWWGILGIIGWSYLVCSLCYLAVRSNRTALLGLLGLMIALFIGDRHGVLDFLGPVHNWLNVGQLFGTHPAIVTAGMLVGTLFTRSTPVLAPRQRMTSMSAFAVGLWTAGALVRPIHGISKIGGTDSYALVTSGICALCFLAFYILMDVLHVRRWSAFLAPIGTNPLLAYLLPDILGIILGFTGAWRFFWPLRDFGGIPGMLNAGAVTGVVLLLTWALTKAGVRLRL